MMKHLVCMVVLLLPLLASAGSPSAPAKVGRALPQSMQQTSRAAAMKQMAECQHRASSLKGAAKQNEVQDCMRGH